MIPKILNPQQIDQFIEEGYTVVREAFAKDVARQVRDLLWKHMGLDPSDPKAWKEPVVHIREVFTGEPFARAFTDRLWGAFDDLMGEGRYRRDNPGLGWWPVAFPGFDLPPWKPLATGWHVDGIQFHHHLNSPDQGLLPIFLFSDIAPGDGGTAVCPGSHRWTARVLAEAEPEGLPLEELRKRVLKNPVTQAVEMTGQAGDVALTHPFILHTRSTNTGKNVRFICNPCQSLREPMNLKRANVGDHSPVELAIVKALEKD